MVKVFLHPDERSKKREGNRRTYPRVPYRVPMSYYVCTKQKVHEEQDAFSENISQTGMHFLSSVAPPLSSVLVCDFDVSSLERCIFVEGLFVTADQNVLAKVMQVRHDLLKGLYSVGIAFIKSEDSKREDVQEALRLMPSL